MNQKQNTPSNSSWLLWVFPVLALALCGWLFFDSYQKRGPSIKILFSDASGLQAEKTQVRFRGVAIGYVKNIVISKDTKDVIATIHLQKEAAPFTKEGSKYWIVRPQVTFSGVSGLETLIEGTYIAALPGKEEGETRNEFSASSIIEDTDSTDNTSIYYLEASNVESIGSGDAVTFRGIEVGSVTRVNLNKTAQIAIVQINVQNRYTRLVRDNTVFWRKVAVQADLGLFGSKIKINSLESVMKGGIEFFSPNEVAPKAKAGMRFQLNTSAPKGYEKWNPVLED